MSEKLSMVPATSSELDTHADTVALSFPSADDVKGWYAAARPILVSLSAFPLIPSKYRTILAGLISAADKFLLSDPA